MRSARLFLSLAVASVGIPLTVNAQANITWSNAAGGNWTTGANWVGGVAPTSADSATFSTASVYNVTIPSTLSINNWTVTGIGDPTFKSAASPAKVISANTFNVSSLARATVDNLLVAVLNSVNLNNDNQLTLQNGGVISANNLQMGISGSGSGVGYLRIRSSSGLSTNSTTTTSFLGRNGFGASIDIEAGGNLDVAGTLAIGESGVNGSHGEIDVNGINARLDVGTLRVGTGTALTTAGTLTIRNGGLATVDGTAANSLLVGNTSTSAGLIEILGTGTVFNGPTGSSLIRATGEIYLLGGTYNVRGSTTFTGGKLTAEATSLGGVVVTSGQTLIGQSNAVFSLLSPVTLQENASLQLLSGSTLEVGEMTIDQSGVNVLVSGANASLGSGLDIRPASGTSSVTFSNGSVSGMGGELFLGRSTTAGSGTATVTVQSGASLTFAELNMSRGTAAGYSSNLIVEDASSIATQSSGGSLVGQNTAAGLATITVRNGGRFQTAASSSFFMDVERNGRIVAQNGGIFELRQDLFLRTGSQVTVDAASQFLISNNADVSMLNALVAIGSNLDLNGGSDFGVSTNVLFDVDGSVNLGNGSAGGSTFSTSGSSTLASIGGLNVASGLFASTPGVIVGSHSTLDVSGDVRIGTGINGANGTVRVDDSALFKTTGAGILEVGGGFGRGIGLIDVFNNGNATLLRTIDLKTRGELQINNATATLGGYLSNGGIIDFQSGTLTVLNNFTVGIGQAIPSLFSVTPNHTLIGGSDLAIAASSFLKLDGGLIKTGTLSGPGQLLWTTGTLEIDLTGTTIGPVAPLGQVVVLDPGKTLKINGDVTVDEVGLLELRGGSLEGPAFGDLTNKGTVLFDISGTAPFSGLITNQPTGIILLSDRASLSTNANIANAGQFRLDGGIARISGPGTITNTGLISGDGQINVAVNNTAGVVRLDAGDMLRFTKSFSNGGRVELNGGTIELTSPLTNQSTGIITGRGLLSAPAISNAGNLALSAGLTDIYGDVSNVSGGRITISGGANATFFDDVNNGAGASLRVSPGSTATFFGTYGGGSITGGGQVFFEADVTPGFSPALIEIAGNVRFSSTSNLEMEFQGATRGSEYDAIDVGGIALLEGRLSLVLLGGYQPQHLVAHRILSAGTRQGLFTSVEGVVVDPTHYLAVTYVGNDIFVTATLPGDGDVDGDVDFDDLLLLAQNYEAVGIRTWQTGDFTGNAAVTFDDLLLLAQNYGPNLLGGVLSSGDVNTLDSSFAADFALARSLVPEPISAVPLIAVGLALVRRTRRNARQGGCESHRRRSISSNLPSF